VAPSKTILRNDIGEAAATHILKLLKLFPESCGKEAEPPLLPYNKP